MKLSDYIMQFRKENKLSARKFAIMCGLSNAYISLIENENTKSPTLDALKKIAYATNIDVDELIKMLDDDTIISIKAIPNDKENQYEEHLKDKPELLEIYKSIQNNEMQLMLFDKTKDLSKEEFEQILRIIDAVHMENK